MNSCYRKTLLFMAAFLMASVMAVAQTDEPVISADRPGMATGTDIMPKGKVQWETGVGYEMDGGLATLTLNNSLFRYGMVDWAMRTGAPDEVIENLQEMEDEGEVYERIEDLWPDYPTKDDFFFHEDEY